MNHSIIPEHLDDVLIYKEEIQSMEAWIKDYIKDHTECKKALLIIGNIGYGKTVLAELLLKKYNFQKIELNSTDFRSQKKLSEFLRKTLCFKNVVDMFFEEKQPIGLLMDEIDTMNSDKGGLGEFIQILKDDDKCTKDILSNKKTKSKGKNKEYVDLYNPIVCTSLDIYDKKINDLKKYCKVVHLKKITVADLTLLMDHYFKECGYEKKLVSIIYDFIEGDIRKLNNVLENLFLSKEKKKVKVSDFHQLKKYFEKKNNDLQLIDVAHNIFHKKIDYEESLVYYHLEPYFLPFMIYHNLEKFISHCDLPLFQKFKLYQKLLNCISHFDIFQNLSFELFEWDEFTDILSFYGVYYINFQIHAKYPSIKTKSFPIEFTNVMNKMSQLLVNKKIINVARHAFRKTYVELGDIIYLSELFSHSFHHFKELYGANDKEEDSVSSSDKKVKTSKKETKKTKETKKGRKKKGEELLTIENDQVNEKNPEESEHNIEDNTDNNTNMKVDLNTDIITESNAQNGPKIEHDLIKFMNHNRMTIEDLENVLKLEKFNKVDVKIRKNLNVHLVKTIEENLFY
jgi:hypothetical protein